MKGRILIIGNTAYEEEFEVNCVPSAGGQSKAEKLSEGVGGTGAQAALAVCRLGGNPILLGRIGEDGNGRRIRDFLRSRGADVRYLSEVPGEKTGVCLRLVDGSGLRQITYAGAGEGLTMKDAERAFTSSPDAVYLNFDISYEVTVAACRFAKMKNIPVFLSASPIRSDFPLELLESVDTILMDEEEVRVYTGRSTASLDGCMRATLDMREKTGAKCVVIKRKEKGIYISYGKYYQTVTPYSLRAEDESFADIAFDMAFITHYMENGLYENACEYANIAGTLTASRKGKLASVPEAKEIEEFARVNCPQIFKER